MDIGLVECGLGVVPIRRQHQARRCALPSKGLHGLDIRVTEANTSGACIGNAPKGIKKVGLGPSLSTTDIRDIRTKQTEDVPKTEYSWAARESGISYIYFLVYAESCQSFSGKVGWIYRSSSPLFGTSKKAGMSLLQFSLRRMPGMCPCTPCTPVPTMKSRFHQ